MQKWDIIIKITGVIIALLEIAIAIYKYVLETERKKYIDTISVFNNLFENTYSLQEHYKSKHDGHIFCAELISSNEELYKETMQLLTGWESFSRGLYYNVYDFKIFIYLTPKELAELLTLLEDFVNKERIKKNYNRLFQDFTELTQCINDCVQLKIEGKEISRKYIKKNILIRRIL